MAVLNGVTKIAAGPDFALALRSDGIVFAWGHGQLGQLGNGGTADSPVPVKIAGLARVTGIAAGAEASLATENNSVSAGDLGVGLGRQPGGGTRRRHADRPRYPRTGNGTAGVHRGPGRGRRIRRGPGHRRLVWDWGANAIGQLGVAPHTAAVTRPVNAFAAGSGITQLCRGVHARAEVRRTVLSWGWNQSGQLGRRHRPPAGPGPVTGLAGATQVSAGWQSSYAVHPGPYIVEP